MFLTRLWPSQAQGDSQMCVDFSGFVLQGKWMLYRLIRSNMKFVPQLLIYTQNLVKLILRYFPVLNVRTGTTSLLCVNFMHFM
jgi:hypothetical protein